MNENDCTNCPCLECQRTQKRMIMRVGASYHDEKHWIGCKDNKSLRFIKEQGKWRQQKNVNGRWYESI